MRNKALHVSLIMVMIFFLMMMGLYGEGKNGGNIGEIKETKCEFNSAERKYIRDHPTIDVYVDENLRYLIREDGTGFLQDYMERIFGSAGIALRLTEEQEAADCRLMIVTDQIRQEAGYSSYTSPVFQMDGALFVREGTGENSEMTGVIMSDRLTEKERAEIRYKGNPLQFRQAETAEAALLMAREEKLNFIVGDRSAVMAALEGDTDYLPAEDSLYSRNVCFLTEKRQSALYGVLNECVHAADRHALTYEAGQKWLDGNGPVFMKDSYEDLYMLVMIIFAAVLIAFFIYYQANKNLYHELNDRMEKLAESKQEMKTTFNGVGHYLAELSLDGSIIDINRAFYDFVKTDTANRKIWDVMELKPEHQESLKQLVRRAGKGEHITSIEILLKKQTLVLDLFPIENARGAIEKLLFMAMDVTRERMAERQLLQDNKMIAVGQLAAGVAHEIRNPLGIIRNYCYVLKNMEDEDVKDKAIEHIEKAVDNSGAIINNLLNFSRVSSSQGEMLHIEDHIKSLVLLNKNILKKKNIHLELICPEPVKTFISVEALDMILINLISNATDAMSDNGNLTIRVLKYKDSFAIEVQDTGAGIEEDILQEIFNPFFTTKGSNKGNGLGLYIVYNETNKLNGKIEVESKTGEGSKFKLTLPLRDGDDSGEEANGERESEDIGRR